jgi:hypothetical protein
MLRMFASRERAKSALKTGNPGGLPGRANVTIRSPAASITSPRSGFGTAPSQAQSVDLPGVYLFVRNGNAATGSVVARPRLSLPSSIG